ncbi:MAG: family 2 glycosyl [Geobacteraceae bacterium]|nr:MAG: family 2 glycosyl [Geobacteraceae bacterium]
MLNNKPRISLITVVRNGEATIAHCMASVLNQTIQPFEYIIIDGNSTDRTLEAIQEHRWPAINVISEPDQGLYDAMNKGINLASGDVIGLINSDDVYADNQVLHRVSDFFSANPGIDACYGDLCYVKCDDLTKIVRYWRSKPYQQDLFKIGWVPPHPTLYVRREIYKKYGGFDLSYRIAADFELLLRLFETHHIRTAYIPHIMVKMRLGGTTNRNLKNILLQNLEIRRALRSHNMSSSLFAFIAHKTWSRFLQFILRPQ